MDNAREKRRAEFLARAAEADQAAAEAKDAKANADWKKIADGYHDLAARNAGPV